MGAFEETLRKLLENPKHAGIVITLTCGVGLWTLWRGVDEYIALREQRAQLTESLAMAYEQTSQIGTQEQAAEMRARSLAQWDTKRVSEQDIHELRNRLVEWTRQNGCQLRRIDVGQAQRRKWRKKDHPLEAIPATKDNSDTVYQLRSQNMILSVSGPLAGVNRLLAQVLDTNKLMHTKHLTFKPSEDRMEVVLEMELVFFDLERPDSVTST